MNNTFNKSITEIIKARHSVRTYKDIELSKDIIEKIESYLKEINNSEGIFGGKIRVNLIEKDDNETKLGTYGVIKGATYYLTAAYDKSEMGLYDLGYLFEKVVLYTTSLNLGTVWLGGTFNKGKFANAIDLKNNEVLPIVSPVGVEADKKSFIAKVFGSNTDKRKAFNEIFFKNNFDTPLAYEEAGDFGEVLENVRLAPSAVNKQPWRIVKENDNFHIYNEGKIEMSKIDMGIALCHFHLSAKEKGLKGEFKVLNDKESDKFKYLVSWIL
ncbi:nitroreductase family protein [Terrisporobacter mayombei]|uniref:Putative nitroreductase TM1586 domain-containing protein n=1 Tax=Terrisporobacter mayombei TaxID=1541 RepID=A0ABY9PZX9_9FIRM|nr:nitroreductase family protein [Terrisporobacter mayombei]MCC3866659.1 nitroreductase Nfs [Terrisporobacter mayombei]WMT80896.1 hypothetical protein TEMA_12190 [Terrisporobacter mayombei]